MKWSFYVQDMYNYIFFFSSRRRHTRFSRDWSSDVCSSDLMGAAYLFVVYPSIIHEQIGGPHRGNAQHLMSIVTEMPGNAGAGHTVQQNPQILVARYSSDGADGAGKIVEMPDPHIGQGDQITPALPEITDRLILIRVGLHDQGNTRADSTTLVFPEQLIHKTIGAGHIEYAKLLFLRSCKGWLKSQKEQTGNDRQR